LREGGGQIFSAYTSTLLLDRVSQKKLIKNMIPQGILSAHMIISSEHKRGKKADKNKR